jgi:hypothetical protein
LLEASGHPALAVIDGFVSDAARTQARRTTSRASGITRSTALWVLMGRDEDLRETLETLGLHRDALGELLSDVSRPAVRK